MNEKQWKLLLALRAGNRIRRFHTEPMAQEETVGHHTAGVLGLLTSIYYPAFPPSHLMVYALMHDTGEQWTGDVPANAKWLNPDLKEVLDATEIAGYKANGLAMPVIDAELQGELKFCDSMDCVLKCTEELAQGNTNALHILARLLPYTMQAAKAVETERGAACLTLYGIVAERFNQQVKRDE